MKKFIVVGGAIIAATAAISPYYIGQKIEDKFEQKVTDLNKKMDQYFHVKDFVKLEYKAGWFTSTAKTTVGSLVINHSIIHGPYCYFGLASVNSTIEIPKGGQSAYDEVKAFFDGKDPYTFTTVVAYNGTTEFKLHSPAIGEKAVPGNDNVKVTWQGLDFSHKFTDFEVISSFNMPKFSVAEEGKGLFTIEGMRTKGQSTRFFDHQFNIIIPNSFNINSNSAIDKIAFSAVNSIFPINVELNKLQAKIVGKKNAIASQFIADKVTGNLSGDYVSLDNFKSESNTSDLLWIFRKDLAKANWSRKGALDLANFQVKLPSVVDLALDSHLELELSDDGNKIDYRELYKTTNMDVKVPAYGNFIQQAEFGYKIAGLPKKTAAIALKDYISMLKTTFLAGLNLGLAQQANLEDYYEQLGQSQEDVMKSAQNFAISTVQGTPSVEAHLNLQGDKGTANATFNALFVKPDTAVSPQELAINAISRLNAKFTLTIPKELAHALLDTAKVPEEQRIKVEEQIAQKYPSIIKGDGYDLVIEFKDKQFFVNDEPAPELMDSVPLPY